MQQKHDDVMMMHELKFTNKEINKGITFGMLQFAIISSKSLVAAPNVVDIKVPPAADSKSFLEEKFKPA